MKNIVYLLLFFVFQQTSAYSQVPLSVSGFEIPSSYLQSGKVLIDGNSTTTTIEYKVTYAKNNFGSIKTKLVVINANGNGLIDLSAQNPTITQSSFSQYQNILTITYSAVIQKSLLPTNRKICLAIQGDYTNNQVATYPNKEYDYVIFNFAHLAKIQSMGFSTTGIKDFNSTYYLVEDDVLIRKSSLSLGNPSYSVDNSEAHNIYILIDTEILINPQWHNGILYALQTWNGVSNSNIKLHYIQKYGTEVEPYHDIRISSDYNKLANNVAAVAEFPQDGKAGRQILINTDFKDANNQIISNSQATWNVIHAIGHTLGLKHTSVQANSSSIMNRGTFLNSYNLNSHPNLPTSFDATLISSIYPKDLNSQIDPVIFGLSNIPPYWNSSYFMSYHESGVQYEWKITGINGTTGEIIYNYPAISTVLPEESFEPGQYQIQCKVTSSKFGTTTAIKNITVSW